MSGSRGEDSRMANYYDFKNCNTLIVYYHLNFCKINANSGFSRNCYTGSEHKH